MTFICRAYHSKAAITKYIRSWLFKKKKKSCDSGLCLKSCFYDNKWFWGGTTLINERHWAWEWAWLENASTFTERPGKRVPSEVCQSSQKPFTALRTFCRISKFQGQNLNLYPVISLTHSSLRFWIYYYKQYKVNFVLRTFSAESPTKLNLIQFLIITLNFIGTFYLIFISIIHPLDIWILGIYYMPGGILGTG